MLAMEAAVFDCIWSFRSSCDRKGQSYPVEYCLESAEEYSEGKIHNSEPEPRNGNVNTVYFVNQTRRNTQISRTELVYNERVHDCNCSHIWASCLENVRKKILSQLSFYAQTLKVDVRIFSTKFDGWCKYFSLFKLASLRKLARSRNVLCTGTSSIRMAWTLSLKYLSVKARLMKTNVNFSNRQGLKVS